MKERIITGIDIGSSKISSVIASINNDNKLQICGMGTSPSEGISNGKVQDLKVFSDAIHNALSIAEKVAGFEADNLYVSIAGPHIMFKVTQGRISLASGQGPSEIEQIHVEQVINDAVLDLKRHISNDKYEIIHCIPQYYTIDSQENILNPIGMIGYALCVKTLIILAEIAPMRNIRKALDMVGFSKVEYVFAPIASSKAVLNHDEKKLGALMIDMGGSITDMLMMNNGFIKFAISVAKGSHLITHDLYTQLKTPPAFAEQLKIEIGDCCSEEVNHETYVNIEGISGRPGSSAPLDLITELIEARSTEILEEVYKQYLTNYQDSNVLTAGIVLTGGASMMKNIDRLCFKVFNMPVRIASPEFHHISGPVSGLASPHYSTVVGLLYFALEKECISGHSGRKTASVNVNGIFKSIIKLFKEFV
ncbi:MAG TPA: cell division protein FtsA [Candidatus Cloacimonadota bacterium]|nr:cell division protein FtsA [Candidatus Cloacimonadota bacterium]